MATINWALDAAHSELQFKVKHMMISHVTGSFTKFEATVTTEESDFTTAKISFAADVNSINTANEQRDGHLKSPDFFDAANFPKIIFEGTKMEKISDEDYKLHGNLTMHGVTHAVVLNANYGGTSKDPWGMTRCGFSLEGKVNRKDFGLVWNAVLETGGVAVSEEVKIYANVEFVKG